MDKVTNIALSIQRKADTSISSNLSFFELKAGVAEKQKAFSELILTNLFYTHRKSLYRIGLMPLAKRATEYINKPMVQVFPVYLDSYLLLQIFLGLPVEVEASERVAERLELPYMRLQHKMIRNFARNDFDALVRDEAYITSALGRRQSLVVSDYADMYSITHTVFYSTYLNRYSLSELLQGENEDEILRLLFNIMVFAYKDQHFDLLGEVLICIYNLRKLTNDERDLVASILAHIETDFLDGIERNLKSEKITFAEVYHPLLIMSLVGRLYGYE
ncbi:hypothetical protein EQG49_06630 [Periweissella cryptocerci]|uniref:DUF6895 domain-containing protein n=1 Tax=Periweissella cryptocerci TaxID=2506420 RepID=A0A4P6YU12_9LACO|nr:hypothetical protein [Periweissella cryptocerci]QBO36157.1 hypothetical protein EQG49_06630 [Periweissella cryptocerci]